MKELIIVCIILFGLLNLYINSSSKIYSNPPSYQLVLPSLLQNYTTYEGNKIFKTGLCKNNPNWKYKDDESITCETYAPGNSDCNSDIGINGQLAIDACPVSCGLCSRETEVKRDFDFDSSHFRFPEIDKNLIESKETLQQGYESIIAGDKLNNRLDKLISSIDIVGSNIRNKNKNHKFCSNFNVKVPICKKNKYLSCNNKVPCVSCNIKSNGLTDIKYFHQDDTNQREYTIVKKIKGNTENENIKECFLTNDYKDIINIKKFNKDDIRNKCRNFIRYDKVTKNYNTLAEDCPYNCGECS